ncbi:MAG TPA: FtsW/RodA/SpoVE family cell cycle protein [Moheibacter sp.]|nr:FtsW/RodA/SpoVE family cell cycle protein [Moheibacter sp.]
MKLALSNYIKGDKYLWAFIFLLAIFSFLPVYSASSNLVYTVGSGSVFSHMGKHAAFLIIGLGLIFGLQKVNYKYFGAFALVGMPIMAILLFATLSQGDTIEGANASRWLTVPGTSITIQTSTFASMVLLIYIARYLTLMKVKDKEITFKRSFLPLFLPMFFIIGLIFPANGSTAVILFAMCLILLFIGGFPWKILAGIIGVGVVSAGLFVYIALNHSELIPSNRAHTWQSRIENFTQEDGIQAYQVQHAKAAINRGKFYGVGPGKSAFKQTLPQSSSDFIFAIIVEEYGVVGSGFLIFIFLLILFRMVRIATRIHTYFGTLLVFAVGLPVIFQAFINMGVAVNLFPVTGQPLPMISYGGTSMWVTCIAFGVILSVSCAIKSPEEQKLEERKNTDEVIQDIA